MSEFLKLWMPACLNVWLSEQLNVANVFCCERLSVWMLWIFGVLFYDCCECFVLCVFECCECFVLWVSGCLHADTMNILHLCACFQDVLCRNRFCRNRFCCFDAISRKPIFLKLCIGIDEISKETFEFTSNMEMKMEMKLWCTWVLGLHLIMYRFIQGTWRVPSVSRLERDGTCRILGIQESWPAM